MQLYELCVYINHQSVHWTCKYWQHPSSPCTNITLKPELRFVNNESTSTVSARHHRSSGPKFHSVPQHKFSFDTKPSKMRWLCVLHHHHHCINNEMRVSTYITEQIECTQCVSPSGDAQQIPCSSHSTTTYSPWHRRNGVDNAHKYYHKSSNQSVLLFRTCCGRVFPD